MLYLHIKHCRCKTLYFDDIFMLLLFFINFWEIISHELKETVNISVNVVWSIILFKKK